MYVIGYSGIAITSAFHTEYTRRPVCFMEVP
jgi:hypothetical protein